LVSGYPGRIPLGVKGNNLGVNRADKKVIIEASQLVSPKYSKPFLIFLFSSQDTIVVVLLQNDSESKEAPI